MARATIDLVLPWHSVASEIADLNFNIVTGQHNKRMKSCHPAKPFGSRDFFTGLGYHTHILKGYFPSPESLVIPSKPTPTERTAEYQPFYLVHKHSDDPHERVVITSGSFSIHASQLKEHEALARKTAAAFSNTLSIAEYVYNQPEVSEESKAGLQHLILDLVTGSNFAWRMVHNNMLMRCSVALDNLSRTIPVIDSDQTVVFLHAPFRGTTLSGLSRRRSQFSWTPLPRAGACTLGIPRFWVFGPAPHQYAGAQGSSTLGLTITCHHVMIATDNNTVVAYINKQGGPIPTSYCVW